MTSVRSVHFSFTEPQRDCISSQCSLLYSIGASSFSIIIVPFYLISFQALARKILKKPVEVQIGGKSVVSNTIDQHVLLLEEDQKFFKLLELLGIYQSTGSSPYL